jgi:hypothetical protein
MFSINSKIFTSTSAIQYSKNGKLEEWIHLFLNNEGNNLGFSKGLKLEKRYYIHPEYLPLSLFSRCCGPENGMKYAVSIEDFEKKIANITNRINNGWDIPPLIVNYSNGIYELNDGNHRYEALIRSGYKYWYAIIWITENLDYLEYINKIMPSRK